MTVKFNQYIEKIYTNIINEQFSEQLTQPSEPPQKESDYRILFDLLGLLSMVPNPYFVAIGTVADSISAYMSYKRKDPLNFILSIASIIPGIEFLANTARATAYALKMTKSINALNKSKDVHALLTVINEVNKKLKNVLDYFYTPEFNKLLAETIPNLVEKMPNIFKKKLQNKVDEVIAINQTTRPMPIETATADQWNEFFNQFFKTLPPWNIKEDIFKSIDDEFIKPITTIPQYSKMWDDIQKGIKYTDADFEKLDKLFKIPSALKTSAELAAVTVPSIVDLTTDYSEKPTIKDVFTEPSSIKGKEEKQRQDTADKFKKTGFF